ncbi:DNA cytosine methyltransferase [Streptomyces sp. INA 01156]
MDWFAGCGGSTQGTDAVPNVKVTRAANHWRKAIESHERNFPGVAHYIGDIRKAPVWAWPITDIHWASPECTNWSVAKGKKRSFAKAVQGDLLDLYAELEEEKFQTGEKRDSGPTEEEEASRALMEEIPLYLRGVIERGGLVKAGSSRTWSTSGSGRSGTAGWRSSIRWATGPGWSR